MNFKMLKSLLRVSKMEILASAIISEVNRIVVELVIRQNETSEWIDHVGAIE